MAGSEINLVDYNTTTAFWSFLIYCLVVVFVAVFFLFYSSRVFAQLLSKLIRWFTWRHLKAYIEFGRSSWSSIG
jgi:glycopeptide antibiotics resistance protein